MHQQIVDPPVFEYLAEDFDARPRGSGSRVARGYRSRIRSEALRRLAACADKLGLDLDAIRERVAAWDVERKWSPAPYAYVHNLMIAMDARKLDPVFEALNELRLLEDQELYDAELTIGSILTERWEREFVAELRANSSRSESGKSIIVRPLLDDPPEEVIDALRRAISTLRETDPDIAEEWDAYVTRLKLFVGRSAIGVTAPRVMGAMYLKIPADIDPYAHDLHSYFVNQLVHELAHLHLHQLQSQDPMITNDRAAEHEAPIRKDRRPMFGVFHATFVLSRTIRVHERVLQRHPDDDAFRHILDCSYDQIETGFASCSRAAQLTPLGRRFYDTIRANYVGPRT